MGFLRIWAPCRRRVTSRLYGPPRTSRRGVSWRESSRHARRASVGGFAPAETPGTRLPGAAQVRRERGPALERGDAHANDPLPVEEIVAQRPRDRAEGERLPRNVGLGEQRHLEALGPGAKSRSASCARNITYTWLICGRLMTCRGPRWPRARASSSVSRTAPADTDSPFSRKPAGSVHRPYRGSIARRHSSTRSSHSGGSRRRPSGSGSGSYRRRRTRCAAACRRPECGPRGGRAAVAAEFHRAIMGSGRIWAKHPAGSRRHRRRHQHGAPAIAPVPPAWSGTASAPAIPRTDDPPATAVASSSPVPLPARRPSIGELPGTRKL